MHLFSLSAPLLTLTFGCIVFATPIAEPQNIPRSHVACDSTNHLCSIQQTCDNAPSIVAGTVPNPWPSTITPFANPLPSLQPTLNSGTAAAAATNSKRLSRRQPSTVRWCALGTQVYIMLAIQGTQSASALQTALTTAITQVETKMLAQTPSKSRKGIAAGSGPVFSLSSSDTGAGDADGGAKITANNAAGGVNITWTELELGLLMIEDWMGRNGYGWGSASVWNGTEEKGLVYMTV